MSKVHKNRKTLFHKLNDKFEKIETLEKWCESEDITLSDLCMKNKLETKSIYVSFTNKFNMKKVPRTRNLSDQLRNVVAARSNEISNKSEKEKIENTTSIPKRGNKTHSYDAESCTFAGFSDLPKFNNFYDTQISPRSEGIFKVSNPIVLLFSTEHKAHLIFDVLVNFLVKKSLGFLFEYKAQSYKRRAPFKQYSCVVNLCRYE